jgi:CRISPR-associated endoribonuclease Cas2
MYDVSEDALRRQVRSLCRRYGGWQQYSVFEFEVTRQQRSEFETECRSLRDSADGQVAIRIVSIQDSTVIGNCQQEQEDDEDDSGNPANIV